MSDIAKEVITSLRTILLANKDVYDGFHRSILSVFVELGESGLKDICANDLATKILDRLIGLDENEQSR